MMGDVVMECVQVHAEKRYREPASLGGDVECAGPEWCYDSRLQCEGDMITLEDRTWGVQPFLPGKRYRVVITPVEEG